MNTLATSVAESALLRTKLHRPLVTDELVHRPDLLERRLSNKEIAARLVIAPGTVKSHTIHIYQKLNINGRRQAMNQVRALGILPPR